MASDAAGRLLGGWDRNASEPAGAEQPVAGEGNSKRTQQRSAGQVWRAL
jgi:hypothetical protein